MSKICRELELEGIRSPKGNKKWCSATVRDIIKNEAYTGTAHFGKTQHSEGIKGRIIRTPKGEKKAQATFATKSRPKDLWIPINVPQIISESDFQSAQIKIEENIKRSSRNTLRPSILQGLLVCGFCGGSYYKKVRSSKYSYYCCSRRLNGYGCNSPSVSQRELDIIVWEHVINLINNPTLIEAEMARRVNENQERKPLADRFKDINKELQRISKSRDKLLDAYQDGESLTLDELKARLKTLELKQKVLLKEKKSIQDFQENEETINSMNTRMEGLQLKIKNSDTLSVVDKQNVLRLLVEDIIITGDQIEIRHCIPCNAKIVSDFSPLRIDGY